MFRSTTQSAQLQCSAPAATWRRGACLPARQTHTMNSLLILIPVSLVLLGVALWAFTWSVRNGQLDDLEAQGEQSFKDIVNDD
jgi:cbb3-type cytochrome oxidase maturation protein